MVCFGSGTATFDKRGTIESEIEERCSIAPSSAIHFKTNLCDQETETTSMTMTEMLPINIGGVYYKLRRSESFILILINKLFLLRIWV